MLAVAIAGGEFRRDCRSCTPELRVERGCDAPSEVLQYRLPDGESVYRCPLRVVSREAMTIVGAHGYAQLGLLPEAGGVLDQPAGFLRAVEYVGALLAQQMEEKSNDGSNLGRRNA